MKERKWDTVEYGDRLLKHRPNVIDAKLLKECRHFELNGDGPALIIENADDWIREQPSDRPVWLDVGTAVVSWGVLAMVPYPDICRALVMHASSAEFGSGEIFDRNAVDQTTRAAIYTCVRFENAGMVSIETILAEQTTEVKMVRDLFLRSDISGLN